MRGRSWRCLLVVSLVALPVFARGQTDGVQPSREVQPEQITSDQVAADFVRSLAAAALPREAVRRPLPPPLRPIPPITTWGTIRFPQIVQSAGTIFSGTVTGIARQPATRGRAIETVAITFRVERAIRGATPGDEITISQWMGLWSSGQRYRVGEHVLLFLYPQSKLGLTSCVAAPLGRFAIDPQGRVLLTTQQLAAFRTDPVLGGKSRARFSDFARAVQQAGEAE